ncbi:hypothetical protein QR680_014184 [Steinernema hermaphroditum]|uniref:Elongation of very long chain fatty acids protein n=1 Tax=Steinernema hermaphroditum TaxID=289476 RepID=A0AA39I9J9_9BILA|nr:hypothetical protein QR680_014184 [Steinernema hermaphroditum]
MIDFAELTRFEIYQGNSTASLHNDYVYKYALPFERVDDPIELTLFLQRNWHHTITISALYFGVIKAIQWWMRDRPAFQLQKPLFLWNAVLAVFSIAGFVRFSEDFAYSIFHENLYRAICYSVHPNSVAAFWSLLFAISKIIELGDTLFIVLRKKPLIFLHYYHHAAVLIYTVHSGAEHTAPGRVFIVMNYFAHSVMYTYYAVTACGLKPSKWISMTVTSIQLGQMLAGVLVTFVVYKIKVDNQMSCQQSMGNLYLAFIIYATFALLFLQFFINNYLRKASKKRELAKKDK